MQLLVLSFFKIQSKLIAYVENSLVTPYWSEPPNIPLVRPIGDDYNDSCVGYAYIERRTTIT